MEAIPLRVVPSGFGETSRRDSWWATPLGIFVGLSLFVIYATWAAFQNAHYTYGPYLSPFYSPVIWGESSHAWLGPQPDWWPAFAPFSPALLILPFPGLFRFTCYYYRGAYYKAFWADPPACTVGEPRQGYWGENRLPLIFQNIHRYFMYVAVIFLFILSWDVFLATRLHEPADRGHGVRSRPRHDHPGGERRAPDLLHPRLPRGASHRRRLPRRSVEAPAGATRRTPARRLSTTSISSLPGAASSRWRSPTSTSGFARWGSGVT